MGPSFPQTQLGTPPPVTLVSTGKGHPHGRCTYIHVGKTPGHIKGHPHGRYTYIHVGKTPGHIKEERKGYSLWFRVSLLFLLFRSQPLLQPFLLLSLQNKCVK